MGIMETLMNETRVETKAKNIVEDLRARSEAIKNAQIDRDLAENSFKVNSLEETINNFEKLEEAIDMPLNKIKNLLVSISNKTWRSVNLRDVEKEIDSMISKARRTLTLDIDDEVAIIKMELLVPSLENLK